MQNQTGRRVRKARAPRNVACKFHGRQSEVSNGGATGADLDAHNQVAVPVNRVGNARWIEQHLVRKLASTAAHDQSDGRQVQQGQNSRCRARHHILAKTFERRPTGASGVDDRRNAGPDADLVRSDPHFAHACIHVRVAIDESRQHIAAGRVEDTGSSIRKPPANRADNGASDTNVDHLITTSRRVEHVPTPYDEAQLGLAHQAQFGPTVHPPSATRL